MKKLTLLSLVLVVVVGMATATAAAKAVTLTGNVMCAKCTLKADGAKECQDVLVVTDSNNVQKLYYVAKNAVLTQFGHQCKGEKAAVITGELSEKDGKTWITPTKMTEKN